MVPFERVSSTTIIRVEGYLHAFEIRCSTRILGSRETQVLHLRRDGWTGDGWPGGGGGSVGGGLVGESSGKPPYDFQGGGDRGLGMTMVVVVQGWGFRIGGHAIPTVTSGRSPPTHPSSRPREVFGGSASVHRARQPDRPAAPATSTRRSSSVHESLSNRADVPNRRAANATATENTFGTDYVYKFLFSLNFIIIFPTGYCRRR